MKKVLLSISLMVFSILVLTGCTTNLSYTFNVDTGDNVKIELNTTDGHKMTSELPFKISLDDKTLSEGTFITNDGYNQYKNAIDTDSNAKIIDSGDKGEISYIFYSYNDKEYNYLIKIKDSKTGLLIGNSVSEESAKDVFERLTITLAK